MLIKLQVYFPYATVWAYNNTISFRMFTFEILNSRTTSLELTHKFWKKTAHNWQTSIDTTQTNDDFLFLESLFFSPTQALNTIWDQTLFARPINRCNFWTCILISHLQHSTTQTPISQTLSSQWQRCHSRRPDLSHITDTNVLTTWLNRTQIIRAKLTRSGKIHLDVSSSGQVPSALIHLKTTEDWGATDYKQSSVGSTNQSNTPKEFTSIQNGLNSFNSSQ